MIVISSLNDQYGHQSFYTSASVNGQPQGMSSDTMPKLLSSNVAILISSDIMQSGMSMHDLYYGDAHGFYFFWFHGCVWIVNPW